MLTSVSTAKSLSMLPVSSPAIKNMVEALNRVNPRLAKVKATELVDNSFVERLEKSGYINEAMKRSR